MRMHFVCDETEDGPAEASGVHHGVCRASLCVMGRKAQKESSR